jgi:hypothetical protein
MRIQVNMEMNVDASGGDLPGATVAQTFRHGGCTHRLAGDTLSDNLVGAILCY